MDGKGFSLGIDGQGFLLFCVGIGLLLVYFILKRFLKSNKPAITSKLNWKRTTWSLLKQSQFFFSYPD